MSAQAKERARANAKIKAKARGGLATIAVSKGTLHEIVQLLKGKERAGTDAVQPWLHPEAVEQLVARKFERQGQRPRPMIWKRRVVRHRTGRFVQLSKAWLRNSTQWQHYYWNANEVDNYGESNWPGRLAQMRKTKKIEKIETA